MRQTGMKCVLCIEAVVCVFFCLMQMNFSGVFSSAAAFPFEQIGLGLRMLSLSGSGGNAAAIILYVLISLIPCLIWLGLKKKKVAQSIDFLLPGLSVLFFVVNYYMINPGLFFTGVPGVKWMPGCVFYSVLSGYLIIRAVLYCRKAEPEKLYAGLQGLLWFLNVIFVYIVFGRCLGDFLETVGTVQTGSNEFYADELLSETEGMGLTWIFLGLHYAVNVLPYLFDIGIVFLSVRMLGALKTDRYSDESVALSGKLAGFCGRALVITVGSEVIFNLLQLVFHNSLYKVDIVINVPVTSVVFVLAALLFARYVQEDQKLKQYNDLFI